MPFTTEQFFYVFEQYNSAVFPFQLLIFILGIVGLFLLHSRLPGKNKFIGSYLGILWIWVGTIYHFIFFAEINPAAYLFGGVFILQGLLILRETFRKNRIRYSFSSQPGYYIGYFLVIFGLIIYPVIGYLLENSVAKIISLGLPCPTTIVTFGFFMLTGSKFPKYLLIIPSLWAIVGVSAAIELGVYQDFMMVISAMLAVYFLFFSTKKTETMDPKPSGTI